MHIVALSRGRAQAGLLTAGFGPGVATADLRAFGKLLADRMQAAGF